MGQKKIVLFHLFWKKKFICFARTSSTMVRDCLCALMKRIPPLTADQVNFLQFL